MPARTDSRSFLASAAQAYEHEQHLLECGTRAVLGVGVSPRMHRTLELLWNMLALAATVWFVSVGVEPVYALGFGAFLIGGEKAIQTYLVGVGLAEADRFEDDEQRERRGGD